MAFSKSNRYPKDEQILSSFAKAFGHPARVSIIRKLSHDGPCSVEELLKNHPISQPALSTHLEILRKNQLVEFNEKFPRTYYNLVEKNLILAKRYLTTFFEDI